jgi:uncharacterized protein YecE (DUF72 family)
MARRIYIGTSGWNYDDWRGPVYPDDLPSNKWFEHYSQLFDTVEINNTFYQQPTHNTLDAWERQAPRGFIYAIKANRYITHMLKLKHAGDAVDRLMRSGHHLKEHLGPFLYQLPPNWSKDLERLREFATHLPSKETHVIEFRNDNWLADDTFELMQELKLCLCVHDMLPRHPKQVTGRVVYVRFHGPGQPKYANKYTPSQLKHWADWIQEVASNHVVYAYFNNDHHGYAVRDAETLRKLVSK